MQYKVNKAEKGKIEVSVEITAAAFGEAYKSTIDSFSKEVNIAGFRPGTAPEGVVENKVGSNRVLNETASFLISKTLSEILKKEDLVPIDSPKIAIGALSKGSAFSYTASFTLRPQVKVGNWKGIKVKKIEAKAIEDADVGDSIKNIFDAWVKQKSNATLRQSSGQASETSKVDEGEEDTQKFIYDARGNKIPIETEGKNKVNVHTIDDEFAKAIGARDLAHLREIVRKDLENIVADQVEAKFEQDIFEEILKLAEIEVAEILVEDELNRILIRLNSELEKQGKTLEKYLEEEKSTIDTLKNKWREQAEKNVKISLIMDTIGREEKVQVAKEELESALAGVNQTNLSAEQKRDLENYLVRTIFQAKTLDLVKKALTT